MHELFRALDPIGLEPDPDCHEVNLYLLGHLYHRLGHAKKSRIRATTHQLARVMRLRQMVQRRFGTRRPTA